MTLEIDGEFVTKRTAKQIALKHRPNLLIEKHRCNNGTRTYYLLRECVGGRRAYMPFCDGGTPSEAWLKACERIARETTVTP